MLIWTPCSISMSTRSGSVFLAVGEGFGKGAVGVGLKARAKEVTFGWRESHEAMGWVRRRLRVLGGCRSVLRPLASRGQMSVRPAMGVVG